MERSLPAYPVTDESCSNSFAQLSVVYIETIKITDGCVSYEYDLEGSIVTSSLQPPDGLMNALRKEQARRIAKSISR